MLIAPPNAVTRSVKAPVPRRDAVTRSARVHVPRRDAITQSVKVPVPQRDAITRSGEAHTRIIKIQVQVCNNIKDAKKFFKKLSDKEREKFDKETLVNLNDTKYKSEAVDTNSPTTINNVNVADTYMVVTILVAAKGKVTLNFPSSIRSANHLKRALEDWNKEKEENKRKREEDGDSVDEFLVSVLIFLYLL
ncbi:hypothetical protein Q3G72_015563 [Acer saccharum]|nr:hypothetical protein Q3G72_015563 [Acer saccharum]